MKTYWIRKIKVIVLLLSLQNMLKAQIRIDTARIDTLGAFQFRSSIMNATCLSGETETTIIRPIGQREICFNRRMVVKTTASNGTTYFCMYLNTEKGYAAYFKPQSSLNANICELNINDPDFFFTVITLKGNVFIYSNLKTNEGIKHYLNTGNTVQNPYMFINDSIASPPLWRKIGTRQYLNGKITATPYKADGENTPKFYLYNDVRPEKVRFKKFLGNVGIGYFYGEDGLFLSTEMENANVNARVLYIENKDVCFNTQPFVWKEAETIQQVRRELTTRQQSLTRQSNQNHRTCVGEHRALLDAKWGNYHTTINKLNAIETGELNLSANNNSLIVALADQNGSVKEEIAKLKISLCNAYNTNNPESRAKKIRCINERITNLEQLLVQFQTIEANNRYDFQKAWYEKMMAKAAITVSNECLMY